MYSLCLIAASMISIQPNHCLRQYKTVSGEKREAFQFSPAGLFYIGHLNGRGPDLLKESEPQSFLNINVVARGYTSAKATAACEITPLLRGVISFRDRLALSPLATTFYPSIQENPCVCKCKELRSFPYLLHRTAAARTEGSPSRKPQTK